MTDEERAIATLQAYDNVITAIDNILETTRETEPMLVTGLLRARVQVDLLVTQEHGKLIQSLVNVKA